FRCDVTATFTSARPSAGVRLVVSPFAALACTLPVFGFGTVVSSAYAAVVANSPASNRTKSVFIIVSFSRFRGMQPGISRWTTPPLTPLGNDGASDRWTMLKDDPRWADKTRRQPDRSGAALSVRPGWTGGHPAVFSN